MPHQLLFDVARAVRLQTLSTKPVKANSVLFYKSCFCSLILY